MPLILTRHRGQTIVIDGPCVIRLIDWTKEAMRIEIVAEDSVRIMRGEIQPTAIDADRPVRKVGGKWRYQPRGGE